MSEDKMQQQIVEWFNNNYCLKHHDPQCLIFSVPNGGTRNKIEAIKLKLTGMKSGVSDLIVVLPNKILFVELKTATGIQSEKQKDFQKAIINLGFEYWLIRSLDEFKQKIKDYERNNANNN